MSCLNKAALGIALCAAAAALCIACASEPTPLKDFETADLMGVVYDGRARSIQDYVVEVDGQFSVNSDVNGRFTLPNLANGTHRIRGHKANFESVDMVFEYRQRTQFLYLTSNSLVDYLTDAELALAKKDFVAAAGNIDLALKIDSGNATALYMQALVAANLRDYARAYQILGGLVGRNIRDEAIYLLLLDLARDDAGLRGEIVAMVGNDPALAANPRLNNRLRKLASP